MKRAALLAVAIGLSILLMAALTDVAIIKMNF